MESFSNQIYTTKPQCKLPQTIINLKNCKVLLQMLATLDQSHHTSTIYNIQTSLV